MRSSDATEWRIEALGPWAPADVSVRWDPAPHTLAPEDEARVAATWARAVETARTRGQMLWAGPLARLDSWKRDDGGLELALRPTDYRALAGTNLAPGYVALGAPRSDALGVSLLARTSDGRLVLQRRSALVFDEPGAVDTAAGNVDPVAHVVPAPDDFPERLRTRVAAGLPCPVRGAILEAEEELGIPPARIARARLVAVLRDTVKEKPQVLVVADVMIDTTELTALSRRATDRRERDQDPIFVEDRPEVLRRLLADRDAGLTCGAHAALSLVLAEPEPGRSGAPGV